MGQAQVSADARMRGERCMQRAVTLDNAPCVTSSSSPCVLVKVWCAECLAVHQVAEWPFSSAPASRSAEHSGPRPCA